MMDMAFLTQEEAQFSSVPPASEFRNGVNATIHDDDAFRVRRHWERFPPILLDNPNACGLSVSIKSKLSLFSIRNYIPTSTITGEELTSEQQATTSPYLEFISPDSLVRDQTDVRFHIHQI